jgi:hypothetical protein
MWRIRTPRLVYEILGSATRVSVTYALIHQLSTKEKEVNLNHVPSTNELQNDEFTWTTTRRPSNV